MLRNSSIVGLCFAMGACSDSDSNSVQPRLGSDGGSEEPTLAEASAETQSLWSSLSAYESWPQFPEATERSRSSTHSNMWVLSYYNDVVQKAMDDGALPLAEGSVIVKENYANEDDATPMALTVMSKEGGDWYWVQATPEGRVFVGPDGPLEGAGVAMCINCHRAAEDNDFVMTHTF